MSVFSCFLSKQVSFFPAIRDETDPENDSDQRRGLESGCVWNEMKDKKRRCDCEVLEVTAQGGFMIWKKNLVSLQ